MRIIIIGFILLHAISCFAQTFNAIIADSVYAKILLTGKERNVLTLECGNFLIHPDSLRKELSKNIIWTAIEIERYFEKSKIAILYRMLNESDYAYFQQQVDACKLSNTYNNNHHYVFTKEANKLKIEIKNNNKSSKWGKYLLPLFNKDHTIAIIYRTGVLQIYTLKNDGWELKIRVSHPIE